MPRKLDRLLKGILILTSATMIVTWLPLVRGIMDGPSYRWGQSFIGISLSGNGMGGQYWVLVLQAAVGISLVYLGWRGARFPFHWLLLLWNVPSAVNAFYNSIRFPEQRWWDSLGVQHLHCRQDLNHPLTAVSGIFAFCAKPFSTVNLKQAIARSQMKGSIGSTGPSSRSRRSDHSGRAECRNATAGIVLAPGEVPTWTRRNTIFMTLVIALAWVGPLFWGSLALLSIVWVVRDLKRGG